jgi:hypothetical protein
VNSTEKRSVDDVVTNCNLFGLVSLKVSDILGREVRTLVNEVQYAGIQSVAYDASGLASGVYFYRLETPSFSSTKKIILLR